MHARHFGQLILLSALWGASFPFIRIASPAFGPWGLAGLRCALAAVVLAAIMRRGGARGAARAACARPAPVSRRPNGRPGVGVNAPGLVLPAGYSAILNATVPLFSMLGAAAMCEERLTARRLAGCLLGFFGVALLVRLGPVDASTGVVLAALACTVASACYGVGAILMKRAMVAHQPLAASAAAHVAATAILLVPMGLSVPAMRPTLQAVLAVAVLGTVTSGLMYWVSMRLLREIPATAATSSALMIPLFGVTWGGLFLQEPVTLGMVPGALLVLAATALITGFNPFQRLWPRRH